MTDSSIVVETVTLHDDLDRGTIKTLATLLFGRSDES